MLLGRAQYLTLLQTQITAKSGTNKEPPQTTTTVLLTAGIKTGSKSLVKLDWEYNHGFDTYAGTRATEQYQIENFKTFYW